MTRSPVDTPGGDGVKNGLEVLPNNRQANFSFTALGSDDARLDQQWAGLAAHASGIYVSFEAQLTLERMNLVLPVDKLRRLRAI